MRATEKEKQDEEREEKKAEKAAKAAAKKEPKPKGRPRKAEPSREKKGKDKKVEEKEEEEKEDKDQKAAKKRKRSEKGKEREEGEEAAEPKAKAKAKGRRTPGGPVGQGHDPQPDVEMKTEMVNLMKRYMDSPYDKENEILHKIYTKKNSKAWPVVYWNRPASGVKVLQEGGESQKYYFSHEFPTIAVVIYMCNKICERFAGRDDQWWDQDESLQFYRLLLITGQHAEKEFIDAYEKK